MNFGTKLKSIRKHSKLSQEDMADLLFTTQGNYSQYENNHRIPSMTLLKRLVEYFRLDANWLLSSDDEQVFNFDDKCNYGIATIATELSHQSSERLAEIERKIELIFSHLKIK